MHGRMGVELGMGAGAGHGMARGHGRKGGMMGTWQGDKVQGMAWVLGTWVQGLAECWMA